MSHSTTKIEIAVEYLELAIEQYIKRQNYFSSLHLAGAAEEILGKYVRLNGEQDALSNFAEAMHEIGLLNGNTLPLKKNKEYLNFAKNKVKHMNSAADDTTDINPKEEALEMIERALQNFSMLRILPTEKILEFYNFTSPNS